jgi:hypothetical protein
MKTLRFILFILWGGMFCMTLFTIYSLYPNITRSDEIQIRQVILNALVGIIMAMICYRSFITLYSGKISERVAADPKMSGFKFVLFLFGIPAIIVPGIFLYKSFPHRKTEHSVTAERLGREAANSFEWHPEPGFVLAFFAGIVLVAFAILYPVYIKRLQQQA